ncbi:hypothetical protein CHLRE_09g408400v5 [Chlamydomonas reinhardtii]|uniref:phytol kinase n=1 Tax=Chlamydomonas reinhardtii TaxID=3055 RepID=A0A2K3DFE6_CHLRE|nr:uncharacterized protein CHLRE_09g408400v5 [Chlamydomonas reinhardtii]PNW79263.1 hypothetical protein CHLRE_09g408400v5 [Chlamydomonas reinhardtii]
MLRADLLSLFAQISTALGNEGDGSGAAGPSTGGHASAIPVKAQVEIATHMAMMLDRLVFPENSGRAIPLSDVLSALERSQVLEHLSGAILRLAASLPPGLRGTGDPNAAWDRCTGAADLGAAADAEFDWACLSRAIKGLSGVLQLLILCRAEELDALVPAPHPAVRERIPETVHFATQVRPLMSGRSVQLFSVMALQSACLGALAAAAAGRAASATTTTTAPSKKAPASAPVVPGAHPLRLDADPMPAAGTAFEGFGASIVWAAVAVFHVTSWGCAQLPVAQPPLDYRPAWSAVSPAAPAAAAAAAAAAAEATAAAAAITLCKGSTVTERSSSSSGSCSSGSSRPPLGGPAKGGASAGVVVPFRALPVFDLVRAAWRDLSRPDGNGNIIDRHGVVRMATVLMVRLLMELRPRQAAARLPGLWREVVLPSIAHDISACSILAGELLRLQVHAPPPPPPPPPQQQQQQQQQQGGASAAGASPPPAAAAAGAALAASSYSCYSLRCALDAGLLPALERFLRNGRAWAAPDGSSGSASGPAGSNGTPKLTVRSASQLLNRINIVLRYSGLWPAALAYAPPAQVVGLVVTLMAAARRLAALPPMPQELSMAGAMSMYMRGGTSLSILHEQLAALLEQALDLAQAAEGAGAAAAEGAAPEGAAAEGAGGAAAGAARAPESGGAGAPSSPSRSRSRCGYLRLNNALEAPRPAPMQWEWLLTAGNTSGSEAAAAAGQRDWLFSFAVQQWLPLLMARISEILLPLDVGMRKVEVPPLPPRAVHLAVLLLRLCAGLLTAAARAAAAEAAEAGAAPRPLPPGGASGRSTSAGTGTGTGHRAEGVRVSVAVRASWREAAYELTHGWQLQQLVDYVATHTQLWADDSSSSGGGGSSSSSGGGDGGGGSSCGSSGGGGDQHGEAEGADGDEAEGGGGGGSLESCVLDALEAVWAHRPEWVVQMLSIRLAAATVDYRTPAGGRATAGGAAAATAGGQAAARAGAASKAGVLMPLRQLAAAHGRAELVLVIDEGVAAVSPAAIEKSPTLPPAPTLNCKHQLLRWVLRRRCGDAAQGGSGGGNGCCLPHAWRLLSPYEVQQRLVTTLATAAAAAVAPAAATSAGAASGTGGADAGSMGSAASAGSAAAAVSAVLCANPDCSSLDGPSALVPPGGGKTCSRCRAARYCCGLCQLQHWREGGHDTSCPGLRG